MYPHEFSTNYTHIVRKYQFLFYSAREIFFVDIHLSIETFLISINIYSRSAHINVRIL
jgi:hypothetical protein